MSDVLYIIKDTSGLFDLVSVPYPDRTEESYRASLHDLERIHPPESDDERAQRHERLAMEHWQEFERLTGKEPERPITLSADDKARLKYALDCTVAVLQHERASGGTVNSEPTEYVRTVEKLSRGVSETINRLIESPFTLSAPSLTAEDLRELQRLMDEWQDSGADDVAWAAMAHLRYLDAEGKLGRSER